VVPVINENDTVAVDELRVGDNDTLSATVAVLVGADLLVILSDVAGLYTGDPRSNPKSALIPTVRGVDAALIESAGGTSSTVGTGGMRTKLVAARRVNDFGIPMAIASGQDAGVIPRLLAGEALGTIFLPAGRRLAGKKHWIRHALAAAGDILVDAGAAKALRLGGKSLLPAGVTGTHGEFAPGDPVRIVGPDGREIARGLTRYSAAEIKGIKGMTTERVRCLGCHRADEVVHRSELVVTAAMGNDEQQ
jgi:glutamate 5-kinase